MQCYQFYNNEELIGHSPPGNVKTSPQQSLMDLWNAALKMECLFLGI